MHHLVSTTLLHDLLAKVDIGKFSAISMSGRMECLHDIPATAKYLIKTLIRESVLAQVDPVEAGFSPFLVEAGGNN